MADVVGIYVIGLRLQDASGGRSGAFEVPTIFDVAKTNSDAKGIFDAARSKNAYDQLAAQLLASKLNVANKVPVCDSLTKTIGNADAALAKAGYKGPGTTKAPTGEQKDHVIRLQTSWITTTTMAASDA